ncbi:hypothetical protein CVS30_13140 [Arthrobacter psychrolactophilus]|uniref:DUF1129 domain-containing protein n=1 Tax=Arthrobacter psychrolactophilus TaxID=92442 RepID=A0A2V5IMN5_9MICC|nr:hypothetical protein [Arthrobacter psychrolactophilus]PYI37878.1 hypothetical protein CVS30_13140 [Arthrobacter psychrolactophilus]
MTKEQTMKTASHKKWLDELTLELRLNDVSGKSIGDTLATVEEFLADSGQSPEEAFGTPRRYAAELAGGSVRPFRKDMRRTLALGTTSLVLFLVFSAALTPWLAGGQLFIGGLQLIFWVVLAAIVVALPLYLPFLLRHFWAVLAVPLIGGTFGVFSAILTPDTADDALLSIPPTPVLLISVGLLIFLSTIGTVLNLREKPDPVIHPLEDGTTTTLKARWLGLITEWLFPILAVVLLGITALFPAGT